MSTLKKSDEWVDRLTGYPIAVNKVPPILYPLFRVVFDPVELGRNGNRFSLRYFERDLTTVVSLESRDRRDRSQYGQN